MERTLIKDTLNEIGKSVFIQGWVQTRRDHGKIVFLDISDRSGLVQTVSAADLAAKVQAGFAVAVEGLVKERPKNLVNPKLETGKIEIEIKKIEVLAKSESYPFDMGSPELKLELPTLLDYRSLTLRHPKVKEIFQIQAAVLAGFREVARKLDCTEIVVPTIAASATEGGAEVFPIDYFGHRAFLTQSPQLYKQMLVPVFERVFTISKAYRAEPSVTTRHLTEATQMDCEFCFVNFENLLDLLEEVGASTLKYVQDRNPKILEHFGLVPISFGKIPRLTMREAQQIIFKEFNRDIRQEQDLSPQDETDICKWAVKKYQSDLVTITHFPTKKRAFYSMPDPKEPEYSLSYDLLFRGLEILSGSQRISDYDELVSAIKDRGLDSAAFEMYLMAFKYGMPPEGGFSFGLERMTKNILNLENIREASLYPRDMERVDIRLSTLNKKPAGPTDLFAKIKQILDKKELEYKLYEHEKVLTSEEAAKARGTRLSQGAKALVMFADKKAIMIVLPADRRVDFKKFKLAQKIRDLKMGTAEEVKKLTGVEIGAVPPFGNLLSLTLYVDQNLQNEEKIVFNAGLHSKSILLKYSDYIKITDPIIGDYTS
ncbi:aspartate--tRNA(Asn) ligase [Candidatus Gottesmanbacteria bacterium]|nr:aspartate--tRNA(Asn) ligase [Candidatus Gottesmanbacteria bacterium]